MAENSKKSADQKKIQELQKAFAEFKIKVDGFRGKRNKRIKEILKELDEIMIQDILKKLKE